MSDAAPERFLSANPHFAKSALGRYRPEDFIALVDRHRIAWHEKTLGQLFCDGSARQIVHMLMEECAKGAVRISLGKAIAEVSHADGLFTVRYGDEAATAPRAGDRHRRPLHPEDGRDRLRLRSGAPVRAEGGGAAPGPGAADPERRGRAVPRAVRRLGRGRRPRRQDGVPRGGAVHPSRPFRPGHPANLLLLAAWRGDRRSTSCRTRRRTGRWRRSGRGRRPISTPCSANCCPAASPRRWRRRSACGASSPICPTRSSRGGRAGSPTGASARTAREGFAKAEVTAGGISTAGLSSQTMEARQVPGLYAIGEAVDVTGWLGGYNFQWAWASGWAAAQVL